MHRLIKFRLWLITVLTSGFVAITYELKDTWDDKAPSFIVVVVSLVLGGKLAEIITNGLTARRWVRRFIADSGYVEGYWYLKTDKVGESPLNSDGIVYIHHEPSLGETKVVTTRITDEGNEFPTVSEIAYVRGDGIDKSYLNHFRLTYPGPVPKFGLSSGRFIRSDGLKSYPTYLESLIILAGEDVVRRQSAERIDDKIVRKLAKKHGRKWMAFCLKEGKIPELTK